MIKIYLRGDQLIQDISHSNYQDSDVILYAPKWCETALAKLREHLPNTGHPIECQLIDSTGRHIQESIDPNRLDIKHAVQLARNEPVNCTGVIKFSNYAPVIKSRQVILSLKDLIRQTIIIGIDETVAYGGYGSPRCVGQQCPVILVDLIGLQFQQPYNTGRLVLYGDQLPSGVIDNFIYEQVVGEPRKQLDQVKCDKSSRYIKHSNCYFDLYAYKMFVARDFHLVCLALNEIDLGNNNKNKNILLKFLKYGTGFFAGQFRDLLDRYIYDGIVQGLQLVFDSNINKRIKCFEFPYYLSDKRIEQLCKANGVDCVFSRDDALRQTRNTVSWIMAVTNCADPHSVTGNEMGFSSVDAAIAENLRSKANKFSPIINKQMSVKFVDI